MTADLRFGKTPGELCQFSPTEAGLKPMRSKVTCDCGHGVMMSKDYAFVRPLD